MGKVKVEKINNKRLVMGISPNELSNNEILVEQNGDTISLKERVNGKVKQITSGGGDQPIEINDGREYYFVDNAFSNSINPTIPLTSVILHGPNNNKHLIKGWGRAVLCLEVGDEIIEESSSKEMLKDTEGFENQIQITKYNYFNLNDITQPVFIDFEPNKHVTSLTDTTITITNELKNRLQNTNTKRTMVFVNVEDWLDILKYEKKNGLEYLTVEFNGIETKEYICTVEAPKPEEPTYLRYTHYVTNNATGGYYVEKDGKFELVEFNNATVEVKLDSDYSGNYKEGHALFSVTFPGTDVNGYVKNSRAYTYNEELGLITIQGVLQGTGSYNPLTERKDINLKLTNAGRSLQLLNEHVISTTSPNVWTDGLVELQGVEE